MISAEELPPVWKVARLSDPGVARLNPKKSEVSNLNDTTEATFVPMSAVDDSSGTIAQPELRMLGVVRKGYTYFAEGDVIFAKITPCMENGKCAIARGLINNIGFGSTEFHVIRAGAQTTPEWLHLILRSQQVRHDAESAMQGAAGQQRVPIQFLEQLEIPVPPLSEQRRIVARIESLTSRLEKIDALRREAHQKAEIFLRSIISSDQKTKPTRMRNLISLRSPDVAVRPEETYQFAGVYSFGRGVFKSLKKSGTDFAYPRLTRLRSGEFVYPKLMAWEGAMGMVPPECDGCVVSTEFPVFEVDATQVFPEVLDVYFRTPSVWPELAALSVGTNVRRRRLNPQAFLDYEMALPSRATQEKVRAAYAKQTELRRLQTETEAELAAFTPALLAKAFRGEL
jgi:type I restriction enzyme S subunit